jgi:hypothetical protein
MASLRKTLAYEPAANIHTFIDEFVYSVHIYVHNEHDLLYIYEL